MADFFKAYEATMNFEGGYVNDPADAGGETYKGISRKFNPNWTGWLIVDSSKHNVLFPKVLYDDKQLEESVKKFYKAHYWDKFLGDQILNPLIAETLFDIAVNMGVYRAVLFLQKGLNILNRNQSLYPDLIEDGVIGPKTLGALGVYLISDKHDYLIKCINILRGNHYFEYMRKSPEQEKYARGWLNRITLGGLCVRQETTAEEETG